MSKSNAKEIGFNVQTEINTRLEKLSVIEQRHKSAPTVEDLRNEIRELAALCSMSKISHKMVADYLGFAKCTVTNAMRPGFSVSFDTLLLIRDGYLFLINRQFDGCAKIVE